MTHTTYMLFFSANLAFIVVHLYSWLLKWFFKPKAYREHFNQLFPAQRAVGVIYLLQLFELPYLLQIGDPNALLFVNAFALLFFSIQMLIMCELYFFPEKKHYYKDYWIIIPTIIVLAPLFLQAIDVLTIPDRWQLGVELAVSVIFAFFFWRNILMALKIQNRERQANENTYADSDDFPVRFANIIKWVPTLVLILLAINFYANDPWVKFARDIVFIGASVTFCVFTLNPWRTLITDTPDNSDLPDISHRLSDDRFEKLSQRLDILLTEKRIFTEQHITIDTLVSELGTNSKYLTEVIRRNGYTSFYDMVSQHRVRHAISLISQQPDCRLSDIAERCGFSSQTSMNRAFSAQGKPAPSTFKSSSL